MSLELCFSYRMGLAWPTSKVCAIHGFTFQCSTHRSVHHQLSQSHGALVQSIDRFPGRLMIILFLCLDQHALEFLYGTSFLSQSPEAYERLIMDAMRGDATLFTRNDEVEAQWRICDPIVQVWESTPGPLPQYPSGSQGPDEAHSLMLSGHEWRTI